MEESPALSTFSKVLIVGGEQLRYSGDTCGKLRSAVIVHTGQAALEMSKKQGRKCNVRRALRIEH